MQSLTLSFGKAATIIERNLALFQEFGQALFRPVVDYLSECDMLYIVPHKTLHYLPLHAVEFDEKPLCQLYAITYLPSASLLPFCQANNPLRRQKRYRYAQVLTLGVGVREEPRQQRKKFVHESTTVAEIFASSSASTLNGVRATKQAFRTQAPKSDLIHIASHGFFNSTYPLGSGLLLADGRKLPSFREVKEEERHVLKAEEFYQLRLCANLVVLSGCFTGMSEVRPGDELIGLARGVFVAGVPTIMLSLWEAHHGATTYFMQDFYQELATGAPKAIAYQHAQRQLLAHPDYHHLRYWAPFILIGDWL